VTVLQRQEEELQSLTERAEEFLAKAQSVDYEDLFANPLYKALVLLNEAAMLDIMLQFGNGILEMRRSKGETDIVERAIHTLIVYRELEEKFDEFNFGKQELDDKEEKEEL